MCKCINTVIAGVLCFLLFSFSFAVGYSTRLSVLAAWHMVINYRRFGRTRSWHNRGIFLAFAWMDWGRSRCSGRDSKRELPLQLLSVTFSPSCLVGSLDPAVCTNILIHNRPNHMKSQESLSHKWETKEDPHTVENSAPRRWKSKSLNCAYN
jgi:hypothetical protein